MPQHSPGRLTDEVIAHIVAARHRWKWGPRKLRVKLAAAHPQIAWPAESTIGEVLKRAGLTKRSIAKCRSGSLYVSGSIAVPVAPWSGLSQGRGEFAIRRLRNVNHHSQATVAGIELSFPIADWRGV